MTGARSFCFYDTIRFYQGFRALHFCCMLLSGYGGLTLIVRLGIKALLSCSEDCRFLNSITVPCMPRYQL